MTVVSEPIAVHFESRNWGNSMKALSPELVEAALAPYPGLIERIRPSYNADPARTDEFLHAAEVVMFSGRMPLAGLAERAPRLKWVQLTSAGADQALKHLPKGVLLTNARGVHVTRTREIATMALLMMNNHMPAFQSAQLRREWAPHSADPIAGKTVVVLGMGALGGAVAEAAQGLGLRVIGLSRSGRPHDSVDEAWTMEHLQACFKRADFVVVTLPLTETTRGCVDAAALDALPAHAQILNIGRSPVMDYGHLAQKLEAGELAGAMLDVFDEEPLPAESPLWSVKNLIVTPHSWLDYPSGYARLAMEAFAEDLDNYVNGRPMRRRVDPALGY